MTPQGQQKVVGYDPETGKPVVGWDGETGRPVFAAETTKAPERSTAADVGIGAAKGLGRFGMDAVRAVNFTLGGNPLAAMSIKNPDVLESENTAQSVGGFGTDLATAAVPGGFAMRGSRLVPMMQRGANRLGAHATGMAPELVEQAQKRGLGIVTQGNAKKLEALADATKRESSTVRKVGNNWIPISKQPSRLQPVAEGMRAAADKPADKLRWQEVAAGIGGGAMMQSPKVALILGGLSLLGRPLPSSVIGQGLHSAAPALQGVAGGAGSLTAQALMRLFGGDE